MFGLFHSKPDLIVHSAKPLNAEPPLDRLRSGFVTKTVDFYICSHGNLPDLDADTHKVCVTGKVRQPLDLTVADLKARFTAKTVTAVMQCAGNRRADMQPVEKTSGDLWAPGAIGNAEWTGVPLADVLCAARVSEGEHLHVAFEAVDVAENEGAKDAPYGVSIPMAKAMTGEVLLAYAMNGEPLTVEHGAPLRIVVPGYAGVRSAKWVSQIRVQDKPSDAFKQAKDYLLFPPTCARKRRT
jgi:sulfite oxidase